MQTNMHAHADRWSLFICVCIYIYIYICSIYTYIVGVRASMLNLRRAHHIWGPGTHARGPLGLGTTMGGKKGTGMVMLVE